MKNLELDITEHLKNGPLLKIEIKNKINFSTEKENTALDNTLRALKKSGHIVLLDKRWALATYSLCQHCEGKGWTQNMPLPQELESEASEEICEKDL